MQNSPESASQGSKQNKKEQQGLSDANAADPIVVTVDLTKVDIPGAGQNETIPRTVAGIVDEQGNIIDKEGKVIGVVEQRQGPDAFTGEAVTPSGEIINRLGDRLAQVHIDEEYTPGLTEDMSSENPQQQQNKGWNVLGKAKTAVQYGDNIRSAVNQGQNLYNAYNKFAAGRKGQQDAEKQADQTSGNDENAALIELENNEDDAPEEVDARTRDSSEALIMQSPQPMSDAGEQAGDTAGNAQNQASNATKGAQKQASNVASNTQKQASNAAGNAQKQASGAAKSVQGKAANTGRNTRSRAANTATDTQNQASDNADDAQSQASNAAGESQNVGGDADETMNDQQQEAQNTGEEAAEGAQDQEMGDSAQDAAQDVSDTASDKLKNAGDKRTVDEAGHDATEGTGESDERMVDRPSSEEHERNDDQDENMGEKVGDAAEGLQGAADEAGGQAEAAGEAAKNQAENGAGEPSDTADQGMEDATDAAEKGADATDAAEKGADQADDAADKGMEDAGDAADKGAEDAGDAAGEAEEEAGEAANKLDFSILKDTKVNKGGNLVNDKGDIMGHLTEGEAKKLVGMTADEQGQIWNQSGKVVGKAEPIPDDERQDISKDFAPFENFPDAVVEADGRVMSDGKQVGSVIEGDAKRMKGSKVDEDGDILDRRGNTIGKAEAWDEPEEAPEEAADMSSLAGKRVNKAGNIVDANGQIYGRVIEGNVKSLVGRMCDKEGNILSESGEKIGKAELVSEGEREGSKAGPFAELEGCTVAKDGKVVTSAGEVVGRLVNGDPKTLYGRSVDEDGDVLDKNGNTLGKAERWEEPEVEKKKSPLEGRKVNREGNVVDEDGNVIGQLVSGDIATCAGKEVDNDGDVVNAKGNTVGHVSLIEDIPQESAEDKQKREQGDKDRELAGKLAGSIEQSLDKIKPILKLITDKVDKAERTPKEELDEEALVREVKPLIEQGGNILTETNGVVRGMDPDGRIQRNAKHKASTKEASPEEHHLAEMLKEVSTFTR